MRGVTMSIANRLSRDKPSKMIKKIALSFALAFQNIRSHFFHTLLSILGIVIGVASLVAILSLIDGMEKYARDQITQTTSLKAIVINSNPYKTVNGVRLRKESLSIISYDDLRNIKLSKPADVHFYSIISRLVSVDSQNVGAQVFCTSDMNHATLKIDKGRMLSNADLTEKSEVVVINSAFENALSSKQSVLGDTVKFGSLSLKICGVLTKDKDTSPKIYIPITLLSDAELKSNPPAMIFEAKNIEDVPVLKKEIESFLETRFVNAKDDFSIYTNEARVMQAASGFLLFRVIMGLIVGISVLVGGIGVMNVLLISITERTSEIGVRKAVGANRRDIVLQFLSESVTVSALGSAAGLVLGVLGTMLFIPIIKAITKVPFQAAFTWTTLIVISIVAIVVGIVFGTYPAIRAARLDPVDAIRHE